MSPGTRRFLLTMLGLAAGVGMLSVVLGRMASKRKGDPDWRVMQLLGGQASAELLRSPQKVQAFRISMPREGETLGPTSPLLGAFPVRGEPTEVSAADAAVLADVLLDTATYDFQHAKGGKSLTPTLGLRFQRESSRLDVAICPATRQVLFYRHGKLTGFEDLDAALPQLGPPLRRAFPDDPDLAAW